MNGIRCLVMIWIFVIGNTGRNGVVQRAYERQEISDIELVEPAPVAILY